MSYTINPLTGEVRTPKITLRDETDADTASLSYTDADGLLLKGLTGAGSDGSENITITPAGSGHIVASTKIQCSVVPAGANDLTNKAYVDSVATIADNSITYAKIQDVTATDKILGRSTAGAGDVEEISCTAAGRALLDDADAAAQRVTLGLGNVENTALSTWAGSANVTTVGTLGTLAVTGDAAFDTSTLFVDSSENKVGIGSTVPSQKLTVETASDGDGILAIDTSSGASFETKFITGQGYQLKMKDATNTEKVVLRSYGDCYFNTGGSIGIGTDSVSAAALSLQVESAHDGALDTKSTAKMVRNSTLTTGHHDVLELEAKTSDDGMASGFGATLAFKGSDPSAADNVLARVTATRFISDSHGKLTFSTRRGASVNEIMHLHSDAAGDPCRVGIGTDTAGATALEINGALTLRERSADPDDPIEGKMVLWMSDGTGTGDDGDIMIKIKAGGVVKTHTLVDYSAV